MIKKLKAPCASRGRTFLGQPGGKRKGKKKKRGSSIWSWIWNRKRNTTGWSWEDPEKGRRINCGQIIEEGILHWNRAKRKKKKAEKSMKRSTLSLAWNCETELVCSLFSIWLLGKPRHLFVFKTLSIVGRFLLKEGLAAENLGMIKEKKVSLHV